MKRTTFVLLIGLAALAFGAGTASATTGGCLIPEFACEEYADDYLDEIDFSSDPKTCKKQCREFRDACRKVCKQTKECIEVAVTGLFRGVNLECNDLEGSDKSDCKRDISSDLSEFHQFLEQNRQDCKDCCDGFYQDCLDDCTIS